MKQMENEMNVKGKDESWCSFKKGRLSMVLVLAGGR